MKRILLTILTFFVVLLANADSWMNLLSNDTEGTEFYVTYMHANTQAGASNLDLSLFMAARKPTTVTISDSVTGRVISTINIPATTMANCYYVWSASRSTVPSWFNVPDYYCTVSNTIYNRSLRITASENIALYMANSAANSGDASLVFPTNRLGKEYVLQTPTNNAEVCEFAVVAVNDNTTITVIPTDTINNPGGNVLPKGVPIVRLLNKGEVYFAAAYSNTMDLSGTTICADKDVMVYNGSQNMNAGSSGHVCHETTSIHMWGKNFPMVLMKPQDHNLIKVTAVDDTTTVTIHFGNGNPDVDSVILPYHSMEYDWYQVDDGEALYVETTKPAVCFQYMLSMTDQTQISGGKNPVYVSGGSPALSYITPIEQGVQSAFFGAFLEPRHSLTYHVNIVCPTSAIDSMKLDGIRIPSSQFSVMPGLTGYSYVSIQITDSAHSLTNSKGAFTAIAYGMTSGSESNCWSYAYNIGMNCQHQDAYMLIDGVRTNSASKCQNSDNQWIWNFKGVINVDYDSIEWFYDKGKFGSGYSLRHTFNQIDSFEHPIYMVVHRTTPICQTAVVDTVMAQINNAMTYDKIRAIEYHCRNDHDTIVAFPGTVYEKKILADTVPLNITRTVIQLFETQSGCDSIVHFKYQVRNPQNVSITQHICQGSSFTYQGQELTEAGAYPFDEVDEGGCHYTKTIKIIIDPTYDIHIYDTVCDVDLPYLWRHSAADIDTLTQTTPDFVRNFKTKHQCDSIVHLHLIVGQSYLFPENESVCDNELPYIWRGKSLKKAGIYYDSLLTQHGCDSVYSFKLRVLPTYKEKDTAYICDNETYLWRGNMYSSAGLYWDSLKTVNGCDSIFSLLLMVYPSYHYQEQQEVCKKRSIVWRGKTIKAPQSGVFNYFDSLESRLGCDSVYELTLTVHPIYNIEVKRTICQGETYEFAGETERTWQNNVVGNHRDTALFKTVYGCDSVLILNLTVNPVYHFDTVGVTCTNVPFHWVQGDLDEYINQTTSGTEEYYRTYTTAAGCDSTYHLTLTSNNTLVVQRTVTISDRDSVIWEGKVYAGTKYTATTPDSIITTLNTPLTIEHLYESETTGCDSVVRLVITVCPTYELEDHVTTCQYEVYSILGRSSWAWQKDVVGDHDTLYIYKTVQGFDSLMHLYLTVYPIYNFSDTLHTCSNSDFTWTGHKHIGYNVPGTYTYYDNYKTVNGCDSVFRLCLIVEDTILVHVNHVMCDIDTFIWDGTMFAGNKSVYATVADSVLLPDTYNCRRTYRSATGCDSFITLTLTVNQTYEFYDTVETCQDNPYHPNGGDPTYWTLHKDTAGVYDDTFRYQTVNGCDSVRHLHLTVHPEYSYEETIYTCCNNDFVWTGHERIAIGQMPVGSHTYRDSLTTVNHGCDSVHILHLIVQDTIINPTVHTMCDIDTFIWDGTMFAGNKSASATAADSVLLPDTYNYRRTYRSATSCDSFVTLTLTVNPTYEFYDTAETCQRNSYIANEDDPTYWTLHKDTAGEYDDTFRYQTVNGCDSVRHLHLTVHPEYSFEETLYTCCNDEFVWPGHESIAIGQRPVGSYTYRDSLTTVNHGCDSVHILHLIVQDTIINPTVHTMCDIDTFTWDGIMFAGNKSVYATVADSVLLPDTYNCRRTYRSATGCDSFITLTLTVNQTYEFYDTVETCQDNPYHPNGGDPTYWTLHKDTAGVYDDTFRYQTVNGCDSVRHLHLTVHPEYSFEETLYTCCNDEFVWPGHESIAIGQRPVGSYTYRDSLTTVNHGCDSVHILHLIVQDTIINPTVHVMCDIDTFTWDGTMFAGNKSVYATVADSVLLPDTYNCRRTYRSATGCDSFITLTLTVNQTYEFYDTVETCQDNPYHPNGGDPTYWTLHKDTAGVYDDTFRYQTVNGCDSVRHLHLTVHPEYSFEETLYTCCNDEFVWPGHESIAIGQRPVGSYTYRDSLTTENHGCDSVHILHLIVQDTIINPTVHTMCDIDTFIWDGTMFAGNKSVYATVADSVLLPGTYNYRRTYRSATGCDSFITLTLTVNPTYEFYDTAETCQRNSYIANEDDPTYWTLHKDTAGEYDDTFRYQTVNGCDSVRHFHLTVHPEYYIYENGVTCSNTIYQWIGHERIDIPLLSPGVYTYVDSLFTDIYGCDSVHELTLTVIDTIVNVTRQTICDNEAFLWDGKVYAGDLYIGGADVVRTASATSYEFFNTYTSVLTGCDSVERLFLNINPTYLTVLDDDSICQGGIYHFSTKNIHCDRVGTFTYLDSVRSVHGCDSVVRITLRVDSVYDYETRATICDNIEWAWRGHTFSNVAAGDYVIEDKYQTIHGCDSTYTLYLKSIGSYLFESANAMCDYDTTVWRSHTYCGLEANVYVFYDSLKTLSGCDSVYKLTLTVHPHYFVHDTLSMCDNETIQVRQHSICGSAGIYHFVDTLPSIYNCDSIIDLTVYINPTYHFVDNATICSNEDYEWHGNTYHNAGTYYDRQKTQYGCDSIYELNLFVKPAYLFETNKTICDNETYVFHGVTLRDEGDHHFMYRTVEGCDSEYVVHLTVNPTYWFDRYVTICDNETYQFAGRTLRRTGVYYDSLLTRKGCDSVTVLHLTVRPTYHFRTNAEICSDSTYSWRGNTYNKTGVYYDSLQTEYGCDSVYELSLTVYNSYHIVLDTAICDFQTFRWSGKSYTQPGIYYDNRTSIHGCDSITTINLSVIVTVSDTIYDTICAGEVYTFGNQQLTKTGVYLDTICQPMIENCRFRTLFLTVNDPTIFTQVSIPDICADDYEFYVNYKWMGAKPVRYSVLFDDEAKIQGFENIVNADYADSIAVPIPPCVRYESYVRPDHYKVTLQLDNGGCDPKNNEVTLDMLVKYPSWIIEQNWEDVVSLLNKYFNGGYEFSAYYWVVNGIDHLEERGSYIYWTDRLQLGDKVYIMLQRENESYYLPSCEIQIVSHQGMSVTGDDLPFFVYNPDAHGALQITSLIDGDYTLIDAAGRRLKEGQIKNGDIINMEMPYPAGVYFMYFKSTDGRSTVRKVLVY